MHDLFASRTAASKLAILACALCLFATAVAGAEPLLQCSIREHAPAKVPMPLDGVLPLPPPVSTLAWTDNYQRSDTGEWILPQIVEAKEPNIWAVLRTPNGPIALHIEVTIDGKPFRTVREEVIDGATKTASLKSTEALASSDSVDTEEVAPTFAAKSDIRERLQKHFRNRVVNRDEARWLLSEWTPGSPVLMLKHNFVAERAQLSPVFAALDADQNGRLSQDEIQKSPVRLSSFDRDENGVVERSELASGSEAKNDNFWQPAELLTHFEADDSSEPNPGNRITKEQFDALPAIQLRASLGKTKKGSLGLELIGIDPRIAKQPEFATSLSATADALVIQRPRYRIEIVACQTTKYADSHGQVSLGAVIDGLPLWRDLDADGDGRLERSERAKIGTMLRQSDFDEDGTIDPAEIRTPIRLAIGCGPQVHQELAQPVSAIGRQPESKISLPGWFASMDQNKDDELSREEFIGTDEQFSELDSNKDGIIGSIDIKEKK